MSIYISIYLSVCNAHVSVSVAARTKPRVARRKLSLRAENISQKIGFNFYDFHDETFRIAKNIREQGGEEKEGMFKLYCSRENVAYRVVR